MEEEYEKLYYPTFLHIKVKSPAEELTAFRENLWILEKMQEFFRECVQVYKILKIKKKESHFNDEKCIRLF